ncbi:TIGR01777 family oxidoreductase [Flavihumibacter rivuli]|uniref:TIGR01777 family oxidoreductase n=1 Tax=Flavihumibacter rivuli TaxID=2838156 RepID=UPI001BDDD530|nr:TIGR01777 family oxidoreductase [Flavihumibacter rivuli]ULQ56544.1 TIGR01777 family oxidoreductase [Flavihumibacter rivuli]
MATVSITGGTGLIGKALVNLLVKQGYKVIVLTRNKQGQQDTDQVRYMHWDPAVGTIAPEAISGADHIINLAGAGVADKRWTKARKQEILLSRVNAGNTIVKALKEIPNQVKTVVNASAIGWYGPDPTVPNPHPFVESAPANTDYLGDTCRQWEQSIEPVRELGKRLVILRTGIVLSPEGGAFAEFVKPIRFGMAAILSSGKQVISWIHMEDMVRMYMEALQQENWNGIYNAVAPYPVDNKTLTLAIAEHLKGRTFIPMHVPAFVLKAVLGEMSIEVLKSTTVSADKIRKAGFDFVYPTVNAAIPALLPK